MAMGRGDEKESGICGNDAFDYGLELPVLCFSSSSSTAGKA